MIRDVLHEIELALTAIIPPQTLLAISNPYSRYGGDLRNSKECNAKHWRRKENLCEKRHSLSM